MMTNAELDWSTFYTQLRGFVAARVRNHADTDDLVHVILERAIVKSETLTVSSSAPGWLFGIARNAIVDHYRLARRSVISDPATWDELHDHDASFDDADREAVLGCIEPLLSRLPDSSRTLLRLSDMDGKSMQTIADELGISLTATKSRVQRARKELVAATRSCCAVTLDARGRVTELTPKPDASGTDSVVCDVCVGVACAPVRKPS